MKALLVFVFAGSLFAPERNITIGDPPVLTLPTSATVPEDGVFQGEIVITSIVGTNLSITASSDNQLLIPDRNIQIINSDSHYLLTITPTKRKFGTASISVSVVDEAGGLATQSFNLAVQQNLPPVFANQNFSLPEDTRLDFTLTATDPEGGPLLFSIHTSPANGVLLKQPDSFTYRPNTNFFGNDSALFLVEDNFGNTNSAKVTFEVQPVPDNPTPHFETEQLFDGLFVFTLYGEPLQEYIVETSLDLVFWTELGRWRSKTGDISFLASFVTNEPKRFVRAIPKPSN